MADPNVRIKSEPLEDALPFGGGDGESERSVNNDGDAAAAGSDEERTPDFATRGHDWIVSCA